jgi:hypothetical protein
MNQGIIISGSLRQGVVTSNMLREKSCTKRQHYNDENQAYPSFHTYENSIACLCLMQQLGFSRLDSKSIDAGYS